MTHALPIYDDLSSRRRFLQHATTIVLGTMSLTLIPGALADDDSAGANPKDGPGVNNQGKPRPLFGFLVDTQKCIGSGKCLTACRAENNVPEGYSRTWVERYIHFKDGSVRVDLVPETGYHDSQVPPVDPSTVERYFVRLATTARTRRATRFAPFTPRSPRPKA
jgi:hypothetical protein